jgi:hypothetical protein
MPQSKDSHAGGIGCRGTTSEAGKEVPEMADNPYLNGKITNKGSQIIEAVNKQPSAGSTEKKTGSDLRAGK